MINLRSDNEVGAHPAIIEAVSRAFTAGPVFSYGADPWTQKVEQRLREIFEKPAHPYTRALIAAIPDPFAPQVLSGEKARGEIPSPLDPPKGCAFHPRCPIAEDKCRAAPGPSLALLSGAHMAACWKSGSG